MHCGIYIPEQKNALTICFPIDGLLPDSMVKYLVTIDEGSMPAPLRVAFSQLRERSDGGSAKTSESRWGTMVTSETSEKSAMLQQPIQRRLRRAG